jgi:hypothetical protein
MTKVRHGHFSSACSTDPTLRAYAAAAACRGSVISHHAAALIYDLPLLTPAPARPDLTVPPRHTGDVAGALLHRAGLPPEDVVVIAGAAVTSVARTLVDLARTVPLDSALVPMDAALHRRLVDRSAMEAVLARCAIWPNARRAARAIGLADGRSESPLETVSRLVIPRLGLPIPQPQGVVRNRFGLVVGRCDFYWDEPGVFGEADGRSKYDGRDILTAEKDRQEELERLGLVSVRWGWSIVRLNPRGFAARVLDAFERGRLRDRSGFPRKWSVDPPVTG